MTVAQFVCILSESLREARGIDINACVASLGSHTQCPQPCKYEQHAIEGMYHSLQAQGSEYPFHVGVTRLLLPW